MSSRGGRGFSSGMTRGAGGFASTPSSHMIVLRDAYCLPASHSWQPADVPCWNCPVPDSSPRKGRTCPPSSETTTGVTVVTILGCHRHPRQPCADKNLRHGVTMVTMKCPILHPTWEWGWDDPFHFPLPIFWVKGTKPSSPSSPPCRKPYKTRHSRGDDGGDDPPPSSPHRRERGGHHAQDLAGSDLDTGSVAHPIGSLAQAPTELPTVQEADESPSGSGTKSGRGQTKKTGDADNSDLSPSSPDPLSSKTTKAGIAPSPCCNDISKT